MSIEEILSQQKTEDLTKALNVRWETLKTEMEKIKKPTPTWVWFALGFVSALIVDIVLLSVV